MTKPSGRRLPDMVAIRLAPEVVEMILSSSRLSAKMVLRLADDLIAVDRGDLKSVRAELRRFQTVVEHSY
jgi:hypothetical protein